MLMTGVFRWVDLWQASSLAVTYIDTERGPTWKDRAMAWTHRPRPRGSDDGHGKSMGKSKIHGKVHGKIHGKGHGKVVKNSCEYFVGFHEA